MAIRPVPECQRHAMRENTIMTVSGATSVGADSRPKA